MSKLQELVDRKRAEIAARRPGIPCVAPDDDRRVTWSRSRFHLIAEMKRSSLSAGEIRKGLDPVELALAYEHAGVSAISVLTEEHYFHGSLSDLEEVRSAVRAPLLQKDFILDASQIHEAKRAGASFILLIARLLTATELHDLFELCERLRLNALIEVTSRSEIDRIPAGARFVGVNSRDLDTLAVDVSTFDALRPHLPADAILIAESGIHSVDLLHQVIDLGYHGALIGEHFLRSPDPGQEARRFVEAARDAARTRVKVCGITNEEDAVKSVEAGAEALGFVFAESSRRMDPRVLSGFRSRIPAGILCVGVFRGNPESEVRMLMDECRLDVAQTYDPMEPGCLQWPARMIQDAAEIGPGDLRTLWDIKAHDESRLECWRKLAAQSPFALAGGLTPESAGVAAALCRPRWIDVARGVEDEPGKKNAQKMKALIDAVRMADDTP